ncbi:DNA polymerase III PolC-type [compost metagenome]
MKGILDIETGGYSITKNGVCEIALLAVNHNNEIVDTFHTLIKPYTREAGSEELVSYKDDAMAVNGLTIEQLIEEGVEVDEAMLDLKNFIINHGIETIIGHNSNAFDIPRVHYLLDRFANFGILLFPKEDTMLLARQKHQLPSYKLEALCEHFGIVNTDKHTAKGDTAATLELYLILKN